MSTYCQNNIISINATNNGKGSGNWLQRLHSTKTTSNPLIKNNSVVTFYWLQRVTKQGLKSYILIKQ